jgi:hypothetical protein
MKVTAKPNEKWVCYSYNIPFQFDNQWVALKGISTPEELLPPHTKIVPLFVQDPDLQIFSQPFTNIYISEMISKPYAITNHFEPISTDNDMHNDSIQLFNKLIGYKAVPLKIKSPECNVVPGCLCRTGFPPDDQCPDCRQNKLRKSRCECPPV